MADKKAGKSSKKLGRASRQANHNKAIRLHKILLARERHLKNAQRSCGHHFADLLKLYYARNPTMSVGKRCGKHRGTIDK